MPALELDPRKKYNMPEAVFIESVDDKFLAIDRDTGNWILIDNDRQLEIFKFLSDDHCVADLFQAFPSNAGNDMIKILTELEAKRFESAETQHPQEHGMYIYLTNRCNQRCHHCYMYAGEMLEQELSTEEVQAILRKFAQYDGQVVTFTGGEATLRPDFVDILTVAKKAGLKVCVLSNGLLWTQEFVEAVKALVDEVQVSIDGFDKESYLRVRAADAFDKALAAVDRLVNAGIRTTVSVSPLLDTLLTHEAQYIAFAKGLIAKYKGDKLFVKFNTELMEGRNIAPTEIENEQYRAAAKRIKYECAPFSEEEGFAVDHIGNTIFNNCGYGGITIAANGDVYFCSITAKCARQANVRTDSFESIMEKSQKARMLSDVNNLLPCKECPLKYLCGGGCRIKHFRELVETQVDSSANCAPFVRNTPCTASQREELCRLMIRANPLFYR